MAKTGLLQNLPQPPGGKTGWPWTKESKPLQYKMPNGSPWPKISIVTPSYNQGQFLEETIRSVLLQNYPNLEYIIMDGGSTDNSIEIIKKYEPWLTYWVGEKDNGQSDAILRGFEKSSGEIIAWLNSDDYYLPDSLFKVARFFCKHPEINLAIGGYEWVKEDGRIVTKYYPCLQDFESLLCIGQRFGQMACFWKKSAFFELGGFDLNLKFCFDYDMFLRFQRQELPGVIDNILAAYRDHNATKSSTIWYDIGIFEKKLVQKRYDIDKISEECRRQIIVQTEKNLRRAYVNGLIKDIINDPVFFFKHMICKIVR